MYIDYFFESSTSHTYILSVSGLKVKDRYFKTRREAEIAMHNICKKFGIKNVECTEQDKHERKYSNHNGVRFYINRV